MDSVGKYCQNCWNFTSAKKLTCLIWNFATTSTIEIQLSKYCNSNCESTSRIVWSLKIANPSTFDPWNLSRPLNWLFFVRLQTSSVRRILQLNDCSNYTEMFYGFPRRDPLKPKISEGAMTPTLCKRIFNWKKVILLFLFACLKLTNRIFQMIFSMDAATSVTKYSDSKNRLLRVKLDLVFIITTREKITIPSKYIVISISLYERKMHDICYTNIVFLWIKVAAYKLCSHLFSLGQQINQKLF